MGTNTYPVRAYILSRPDPRDSRFWLVELQTGWTDHPIRFDRRVRAVVDNFGNLVQVPA